MSKLNEQVDQIFAEWDKSDSPGCALAVIRDGEIIYTRGYGMANLEHDVPIKPETIFDIGSTSKQFTALSILLLARHGELSLDDPIQKYLPEIPEYENPVTVRNLVHHTSGLRDYLVLLALSNKPFENDYQEEEVIKLIASQKSLNFQPGEEFLYCNSGYLLMAEIVERVSGKNLREYADENIFKPLGMKNTHFHNNFKMIVKNRASAYAPLEEGGFEIDMGIFDVLGDGAVYTNVKDLFLWDQNFYHNILDGGDPELLTQMQTPGFLNSGEALDYAFGLRVSEYRGLKTVQHGGSWYGYRAQLIRFPEQKFSVICLANLGSMSPDNLAIKVAEVYLGDLMTKEEIQTEGEAETDEITAFDLPLEKLQSFCGKYKSKTGGNMVELELSDQNLFLKIMGLSAKLVPQSENELRSIESPYDIRVKLGGNPLDMELDVNQGMLADSLQKAEDFSLSTGELEEYCGDYYSDELDITYTLAIKEEIIQVSPKVLYMGSLNPVEKDVFNAKMPDFNFIRDENGKITSFKLDAGRVKGILFNRL